MIHNPQSGGIHLPTLTNPAGAGQILSGYQAIDAEGNIIVGTIPSQGAQTITPGTANKTIAAGRYLSGTQTIAGDADLVAGNIKSGVNLFGVNGEAQTFEYVSGYFRSGSQEASAYYFDGQQVRSANVDGTSVLMTLPLHSMIFCIGNISPTQEQLGVEPIYGGLSHNTYHVYEVTGTFSIIFR